MSELTKKDRIALVILCYNSADEIEELLKNLKKTESNYFSIVVDNASDIVDREKLTGLEIDHIIILPNNMGFAAGNNVGIRYAKEQGFEYIAVMNSDIELIQDNTLKSLKDTLVNESADFVGPKMKNEYGQTVSGKIITNKYGDCFFGETEKAGNAESVTGALFLFRTSILDKVGYMEEKFFLYREETEYFIRAKRMGADIYYDTKIEIIHKCGSTTGIRSNYYLIRNGMHIARSLYHTPEVMIRLYYIRKHWKSVLRVLFHYHDVDYDKMIVRGIKDGIKKVYGKLVE